MSRILTNYSLPKQLVRHKIAMGNDLVLLLFIAFLELTVGPEICRSNSHRLINRTSVVVINGTFGFTLGVVKPSLNERRAFR